MQTETGDAGDTGDDCYIPPHIRTLEPAVINRRRIAARYEAACLWVVLVGVLILFAWIVDVGMRLGRHP